MAWLGDDPLPINMDGQTVLPGDWVALPQSCRLGPGLYNDHGGCDAREDLDVRTCMAGVLRKKESSSSGDGDKPRKKLAWVDYSSRKVNNEVDTKVMV